MKKIAIIYNQPLSYIQGINYVNNSFVLGKKYFHKFDMCLSKIYSPEGIFKCAEYDSLDAIGHNINARYYRACRRFRSFCRKLFPSDYILGAVLKLYLNHYRNAKKTIKILLQDNDSFDFIIFQDIFSAYYYFMLVPQNRQIKSLLLLHCSDDPLEQVRPTFPAFFRNKKLSRIVDKHLNIVLDKVDKVVYLSKHALDSSSVKCDKKCFIFNGEEDLDIFAPHRFDGIMNIVTVGSVIERKGQLMVIEALANLPNQILCKLRYHVIGDGELLEECKNMVKKLKLEPNVVFYGSRNDVPSLLSSMDCFMLISSSEGMPMSIIEALRQGLFVISTETGGIPEMINSTCGRIIKREVSSIVDAIKEIVTKRAINVASIQASRKMFLENFTLKHMIEEYARLINTIL